MLKKYLSFINQYIESKFIISNESIILLIREILLDPLKQYFPEF